MHLRIIVNLYPNYRGKTFRAGYEVGDIRGCFDVPLLLTTATITCSMLKELYTMLHLDSNDVAVFARLPDRYLLIKILMITGIIVEATP